MAGRDPIDAIVVASDGDGNYIDPSLPLTDSRWEHAVMLLSDGQTTQKEVAAQLGVTQPRIAQWKKDPVFAARLQYLIQEYGESVRAWGIAKREMRLARYQDLSDRLSRIISERASRAEEDGIDIPGAKEGLFQLVIKKIGYGDHAERVEEWQFDKSIFNALMDVNERMARETGQWSEKSESTVEHVKREYVGIQPQNILDA